MGVQEQSVEGQKYFQTGGFSSLCGWNSFSIVMVKIKMPEKNHVFRLEGWCSGKLETD